MKTALTLLAALLILSACQTPNKACTRKAVTGNVVASEAER